MPMAPGGVRSFTLVLWVVLIVALLTGSVSQLAIARPPAWERCWSR